MWLINLFSISLSHSFTCSLWLTHSNNFSLSLSVTLSKSIYFMSQLLFLTVPYSLSYYLAFTQMITLCAFHSFSNCFSFLYLLSFSLSLTRSYSCLSVYVCLSLIFSLYVSHPLIHSLIYAGVGEDESPVCHVTKSSRSLISFADFSWKLCKKDIGVRWNTHSHKWSFPSK